MMIIKLGGSSITYKKDDSLPPYDSNELRRNYRIKENVVRTVGKQISGFDRENLILVHGGGTHGHRTVTRWKKEKARGTEPMMAWEVRWRMDQLSNVIVKVLGEEKVPSISVPTSNVVLSDQGEVLELHMPPLRRIMERGCVPVLRGDMVPDVNGGWSVVSGDTLIKELCRRGKEELEPVSKAVMIMDEEGFLDPDTGELVESIDPYTFQTNSHRWEKALTVNEGDVSGGIWGKVKVCRSMAEMGVETFMIGVNEAFRLKEVMDGGRAGTRFVPLKELDAREDFN